MLEIRDDRTTASRRDDGQDLVEYAMLVSLIALVVLAAITLFGTQLVQVYQLIMDTLPFGG